MSEIRTGTLLGSDIDPVGVTRFTPNGVDATGLPQGDLHVLAMRSLRPGVKRRFIAVTRYLIRHDTFEARPSEASARPSGAR